MERYQTIPRRIAAFLIDTLFFIPTFVVSASYHSDVGGTSIGRACSIATLIATVAFRVYFHGRYGATPGKALMKVRVVTAAGEGKIGTTAAMIRELPDVLIGLLVIAQATSRSAQPQSVTFAELATAGWSIANAAVALSHAKHRALHDLIAGTVVIRTAADSAPQAIASSAGAMQFPSPLANPHYANASPTARVAAGFVNWLIVGSVGAALVLSPLPWPSASPISAEVSGKLLFFVFATLFWLACAIARSSPGAAVCLLRICDDHGAKLYLRIALLRTLPYYAIALFLLIALKTLGQTSKMADVAILLAYLGALVVNFSSVASMGRTQWEIWLRVRVLRLRLPGSLTPKILGIPLK